MLRERHVELIITDLVMSGMNGVELMRAAKSLQPGVQVGMISGSAADIRADSSLHQEFTFCVDKPFPIEQILSRVRSTFGARPAS